MGGRGGHFLPGEEEEEVAYPRPFFPETPNRTEMKF